ncbi:MAG: hypothetical protein EAZ95_13290 [Bacteroidetes bacterium]|nr:MAG: hypothetical protein EAZ95_13290 [Bacteroidota bacterium]
MQNAHIFINELSWNINHYQEPEQLKEAVSNFQRIFSYLIKKSKEYEQIYVFFKGEGIKSFLQDITDFEVEDLQLIKERLKKSRDWQDAEYRQHNAQAMYYQLNFNALLLDCVNETTLAESAERKLQASQTHILLLNFQASSGSQNDFTSVIKQAFPTLPTLVHIAQSDSLQKVKEWVSLEIELRNVLENNELYQKIKLAYQAQKFDFETWKPNENYLPLASVSDLLVKGDWQKFRQEIKEKESEKMAIISQIGRQVALLNGYSYSKEISDLNKSNNKKREIYEAGDGREKIYLSCDFESGGFEICDFSGTHLGEFGFHGRKTSEAKLDHSIKIK